MLCIFFFFKQKTAYEMRISDWSSDVCCSDLVVARAETPFSRADPATLSARPGQVVVQPGNSLWRIARRIYGEGLRYTVIYQANQRQIRNPDLIYPGQVFSLPALTRLSRPRVARGYEVRARAVGLRLPPVLQAPGT